VGQVALTEQGRHARVVTWVISAWEEDATAKGKESPSRNTKDLRNNHQKQNT